MLNFIAFLDYLPRLVFMSKPNISYKIVVLESQSAYAIGFHKITRLYVDFFDRQFGA